VVTYAKRAQLFVASVLVFGILGPAAGPQIILWPWVYAAALAPAAVAGVAFGSVVALSPPRLIALVFSSPWSAGISCVVILGILCGWFGHAMQSAFGNEAEVWHSEAVAELFFEHSLLAGAICGAIMLYVGTKLLGYRRSWTLKDLRDELPPNRGSE
jgi:hypothetical protein